MAYYRNAEIRQGSRTIRVNVDVDGFMPVTGPLAGKFQWGGVLRPPNNTGLEPNETYLLLIPGFSAAKIVITEEPNPVDGSVAFTGIGDMPTSEPSR
jgi:hypothetical protein